MTIKCIKGFLVGDEGNSFAIMQGELFKLVEEDLYVALKGDSRNPGMEVCFTEKQLAENFKLLFGN